MNTLETLTGLNSTALVPLVGNALHGADDGELFVEVVVSEGVSISEGIPSGGSSGRKGFGLRRIVGERQDLVVSGKLDTTEIKTAGDNMRLALPGNGTLMMAPSAHSGPVLYQALATLGKFDEAFRIKLMQDIDAYARGKDSRVKEVSASLAGEIRNVMIVRADGTVVTDVRPLVTLRVQLTLSDGKTSKLGFYSIGGRKAYDDLVTPTTWKRAVDMAYNRAEAGMRAVDCPSGEMPIVLAAGGAGVLFHEAVGHGLEADAIRTGSCFSGMMGQRVAAKGVTIVDDGTLSESRGSLHVDDEGTPTENTVLIEDGILVGYMYDRHEARLAGAKPTGNGRRETYKDRPIVRMRNTYALNGTDTPADIITDTKNGIYASAFSGGQVNPSTGEFVFQVTEGYLIENGKLTDPIKNATLIGDCRTALLNIDRIGNDLALEENGGTCGKNGQGAPVNDGQPTMRVTSGITVGGTK